MKKIILSLILSAALFGCDKESGQEPDNGNTTGEDQEEITSLTDTSWKSRVVNPGGEYYDYELTFTATHCTFTITGEDGIPNGETDTYTYNSPAVVLTSRNGLVSTGTVKNDSMKITIWITPDVGWDMELKKQ